MTRAAIVLTACALVAALVLPPSRLAVYVIVAVAIIGASLAVAAPRPAVEPRRAADDAPADPHAALFDVPAQRVDEPCLDMAACMRRARGPGSCATCRTAGPYDADDPEVAHLVPAAARHRADRA